MTTDPIPDPIPDPTTTLATWRAVTEGATDQEFYTLARDAVPRLLAFAEAVLALADDLAEKVERAASSAAARQGLSDAPALEQYVRTLTPVPDRIRAALAALLGGEGP